MMPPCARLVLLSLGSAARVTSVTGIPASARQRATVPPATPQPRISTSVSMHSLMPLPSWNACVHVPRARLRELKSLADGIPAWHLQWSVGCLGGIHLRYVHSCITLFSVIDENN